MQVSSTAPMSLSKICPLCRKSFPRESAIKVTDYHFLKFFTEQELLKDECPLNPKSPTKKHTWDEFVGKKVPE